MSTVEADPAEPTTPIIEPEDDYDDIDKVRDDLQSTKQLLEIELKNRRKIDEENSQLQSEIRRLKEELKQSNRQAPTTTRRSSSTHHLTDASSSSFLRKSSSRLAVKKAVKKESSDEDSDQDEEDFGELDAVEEELNTLRGQAELARQSAEEFESRYKETANQLVTTQAEMEDLEMKVAVLKKKLRRAQENNGDTEIEETPCCHVGVQTDPIEVAVECRPTRSHSKRDLRKQMSRQDSRGSNVSSANNQTTVGDEQSDDDEDDDEQIEDESMVELKSQKREISLLASRLRSTKDKEKNVRNERIALHIQLKKFRNDLKDEKKK